MAEDKIDSVVDKVLVGAEFDYLKKEIAEAVAAIKAAKQESISFNVDTKSIADYNKNVNTLNTSLQKVQKSVNNVTVATQAVNKATVQENSTLAQNIELRRRLQNSLESYNKSQKDDLALLKSGAITRQEFNKRITESQIAVEKYKVRIAELSKEIKAQVTTNKDAASAYKVLAAETKKAQEAAQNYIITLGKQNPVTIAAVKNAKALSDQLKSVDAAVGINNRNVGNYGSAFNKLIGPFRTLANIIPGLGLSGIFLLLGNSISEVTKLFFGLNKAIEDGLKFVRMRNELQLEGIRGSAKEIVSIDGLVAAAKNENLSRADRNLAIKQLQDTYPSYLKNITLETINSEAATKAINELKDAVLQKAVADAYADKIAAAVIKKAEIQQKIQKEDLKDLNDRIAFDHKLAEARRTNDKATESALLRYGRLTEVTERNMHEYNEELNTTNSELDFLRKGYEAAIAASLQLTTAVDKEKKVRAKKPRDTDEADRKARFEILKADLELEKEYALRRAANEKSGYVTRLKALLDYGTASRALIQAQADFELGTADLTRTERAKIENDKANEIIRLAMDLQDRLMKISAEVFKIDTSEVAKTVKGITGAYAKIAEDLQKQTEAAGKKLIEHQKNMRNAAYSLAKELAGLFVDLFQNDIERQKSEVQDQIDLLEKQKQQAIEAENSRVQTAQERADRISAIEARAASERSQLELRQRQLDQQKARWEKANNISNIIQSTALAIVKALPDVPLSILVGAIGAVQLARAIAAPIPRYAEGTDNHPGGLAYVGDGGKSEGIKLPDGSIYKTPATATLVDLPAGSQVFQDFNTMTKAPVFTVPDTTETIKQLGVDIVKAVKNIPQPIIHAERAWTAAMKTNSHFRVNYLNKRL